MKKKKGLRVQSGVTRPTVVWCNDNVLQAIVHLSSVHHHKYLCCWLHGTYLKKGGHLHQVGATISEGEEVHPGLIEAGQGLCVMLQGFLQ